MECLWTGKGLPRPIVTDEEDRVGTNDRSALRHAFVIAAAAVCAATLVSTGAAFAATVAPRDAATAYAAETVLHVDGGPTGETTLRFELVSPTDAFAAGAATGDERSSLPTVRYARAAEDGATWRARAMGPASFTTLIRVPDTGAVEYEILSGELASSAGTPSRAPAIDDAGLEGAIEVSEPAIMRDLRVVRVTFSPLSQSGTADVLVRSVTVSIRTTAGAGVNEKTRSRATVSQAFLPLYESKVANYRHEEAVDGTPGRGSGRDDPFGARYLIITRDSYEFYVQPLAEWKRTKGIQTMVVRISTIGSTPSAIRSYIEDAYYGWEVPPEYVLLVGDTEAVPTYYDLAPTDNYYAAIDGSDYLSDIMIGRISADTSTHCSTQVNKILSYERTPLEDHPEWPATATLMVADDFDAGDWVYYMNTWFIYDLMEDAGFARIDTLFRRNDIDHSDVYDSVNDGKGFLNFRGQAYHEWNPPFDINPGQTTNYWKYPIIMSATCGTGDFSVDNFMCENWMRAGSPSAPEGSVAFFGTNTALPGSGQLSRRRGYIDMGFFEDAFVTGDGTLGAACLAGKLNLFVIDPDEMEYQGWNLLGDPAMSMWTAVPRHLSVAYDEAIQVGPSTFSATVTSEGAPLPGAVVACTKGDEVFAWGTTDASGQLTLDVEAETAGELAVTITARNCYPFEGTTPVLESGPFVMYSDLSIDDAEGGNDDGYLSPGETAAIAIELLNVGDADSGPTTGTVRSSDPFVTIVDSLASYGVIAPDATAWGEDDYEISLSAACPVGHEISYTLVVDFGGEPITWTPPPIPVSTGRLAHDASIVLDEAPGGDGSGTAGPGESVGLTLVLQNEGACGVTDIEGTLGSRHPLVAVTSSHAPFGDAGPGAIAQNDEVPFIVSVMPGAPTGTLVTLELVLAGAGHSYAYAETVSLDLEISGSSAFYPTGPDSHGYYAYDANDSLYAAAPAYEWVDIAPPGPGIIISEITDEDAAITTIPLPFPFNYYGETYLQVSVSSNGFITMDMNDYLFGDNSPIPSLHGPTRMIAPFWDDLDPSAGGDIYKWYDEAEHRFIIQYDEVARWGAAETETFQVIFKNEPTPTGDGIITFQYESVAGTDLCTVGIENRAQTDGVQYLFDGAYGTHASPLRGGLAIAFTTEEPGSPEAPWLVLTDVSIDDSADGNGNGLPEPGETITLSLEFANEGVDDANGISLALSSPHAYVSLVDSTAVLPNIPSGGSAETGAGELVLSLSHAIDDTVATIYASLQANGGAYAASARHNLHVGLPATGIDTDQEVLAFRLFPCAPNPFTEGTRVRLALPNPERVALRVYNTAGRLVATVHDAPLERGLHTITWDGSGVYLMRVEAGRHEASRKVVLLK